MTHSPRETHLQTALRPARNIGRVMTWNPLGPVAASHFPPKVYVLHRASALLHSRLARDSPKMPQDRPKTVQDKPKTAQDRPNTAQDRTKAAKDRPKIAPSASCIVFYKHSERLLEHSNTPSRSCIVFYKHFGRKVTHSPRETHPQTAPRPARNIGRAVTHPPSAVWRQAIFRPKCMFYMGLLHFYETLHQAPRLRSIYYVILRLKSAC